MKKSLLFLGFTFLLSYVSFSILTMLSNNDVIAFNGLFGQSLFILGGSSPTIIAIILIMRLEKKDTQEIFFKSIFKTEASINYWIIALILPLVIGLFFQMSYRINHPEHTFVMADLWQFVMFFLAAIVFGGLEEVGWRGYLLPRLTKQSNLLIATLLTGIIWGFWHLPLFFLEAHTTSSYAFIPYLLGALMYSTYLSILYVKTKSILLTILFHAAINATSSFGLPIIFEHDRIVYAYLITLTVIGFAIIYKIDQKESV